MKLALRFTGEVRTPQLLELLQAIAGCLFGAPVVLAQKKRTELPDENSPQEARESWWVAPAIELHERIECGPGNPRDGWGYDTRYELRIDGKATGGPPQVRVVSHSSMGWSPWPSELTLDLDGVTLAELDAARAVVRQALGEARDQTDGPATGARNIHEANARGEAAAARTLLERCTRGSSDEARAQEAGAWSQVLALRIDVEGDSDEAVTAQVDGDPAAVAAWRKIGSGARRHPRWSVADGEWAAALLSPWSARSIERAVGRCGEAGARLGQHAARWLAHPRFLPVAGEESTPGTAPPTEEGWVSLTSQRPTHSSPLWRFAVQEAVFGPAPWKRHRSSQYDRGALVAGNHGGYYPYFACDPGTWTAEWSAWLAPTAATAAGVPPLEAMVAWNANTDGRLHHWTWYWSAGGDGLLLVEARTFPPGSDRAAIIPAEWDRRDKEWRHLGAYAVPLGDAAWRDAMLARLAAITAHPVDLQPATPSAMFG